MPVVENVDPKANPITTWLGVIFILISSLMEVVKYIVPAFVVLKAEIPYEWYVPLIPFSAGIFLILFANDKFSERIFNRVDKAAAKKTGTDGN